MTIEILTERFLLRELSENDATPRYLGWLRDHEARKYINTAGQTNDLESIKKYVRERVGREDVLFLGIFERKTGSHVGNIKYEPINARRGYTVMGILIGEPEWRDRGVAAEVIQASGSWLRDNRGIKEIVLGVSRENKAAMKAYAKAGFIQETTDKIAIDDRTAISMVMHLIVAGNNTVAS